MEYNKTSLCPVSIDTYQLFSKSNSMKRVTNAEYYQVIILLFIFLDEYSVLTEERWLHFLSYV